MKRFFQLQWFLSMILSVFVVSCSDKSDDPNPDTGSDDNSATDMYEPKYDSGDGYEVAYQFKKGVTVMGQSYLDYLLRIENDSILYFSSSTPSDILPAVGDVLSCTVTDKTPYGLGNIVKTVTDYAGEFKCVTTVAQLNELFEKLEVSGTIPLSQYVPETILDEKGNKVEYSLESAEMESKSRSVDCLKMVFHPSIDPADGKGFYANGEFYILPRLHVDINLEKKKFDIVLDLTAGFDLDLGIKSELKSEGRLMGPAKVVEGCVVWGPLILRPSINLSFGYEAQVEGRANFGLSYDVTIGGGRKDGRWIGNAVGKDPSEIVNGFDVDASGHIYFVIKPELEAGLYTKNLAFGFNPEFHFGPSFEYCLTSESFMFKDACLGLDAILKPKAYLLFNWFGKEVFKEDVDLLDIVVADWDVALLPILKEGSFKMTRHPDVTPAVYNIEYSTIENGFLSAIFEVRPGVAVLKDQEIVLTKIGEPYYRMDNKRDVSFEISGLDDIAQYDLRRCVLVNEQLILGESLGYNELVGTWKQAYGDGYWAKITFEESGEWYEEDCGPEGVDTYYGTYDIDTDKQILYKHCHGGSDGPFESEFYYKVKGDELHLMWTDGDHGWQTWKRVVP